MSAFGALRVVDHLPALMRYARSLTRDELAAEDLVQDTLTAAYGKSDAYRREFPLRNWLFAILHNRFVSDTRHRMVENRALSNLALVTQSSVPPNQETTVCLDQVAKALDSLPTEQREALHLVAVEGLSYGEAADALDIRIGTLMSRLSRARGRLREATSGSADEAESRSLPLRIVKG